MFLDTVGLCVTGHLYTIVCFLGHLLWCYYSKHRRRGIPYAAKHGFTSIKKLYESYAMGKMPEARYETLSAEYEQEQAELIELVEQNQTVM